MARWNVQLMGAGSTTVDVEADQLISMESDPSILVFLLNGEKVAVFQKVQIKWAIRSGR